ncbi:hypothetical protein ACFE04_023540 [Oxalis oulophora]
MEDKKYSSYLNKQTSSVWKLLRDEEFEEGDVWDCVNETKQQYPCSKQVVEEKSMFTNNQTNTAVPRKLPNAAKMIPRNNSFGLPGFGGGDSSISSCDESKPIKQQSAPIKIVDWSKVYGAGRTLKGRDLSKVRNAVLLKTGFLEN